MVNLQLWCCEALHSSSLGLRKVANIVTLNRTNDSVPESRREYWGWAGRNLYLKIEGRSLTRAHRQEGETGSLWETGPRARPPIPVFAVLAQREVPPWWACALPWAQCASGLFWDRRQLPFCGTSSEALALLGAAVDAKFRSLQHPQSQ